MNTPPSPSTSPEAKQAAELSDKSRAEAYWLGYDAATAKLGEELAWLNVAHQTADVEKIAREAENKWKSELSALECAFLFRDFREVAIQARAPLVAELQEVESYVRELRSCIRDLVRNSQDGIRNHGDEIRGIELAEKPVRAALTDTGEKLQDDDDDDSNYEGIGR